jgi:hypothetical protein
VDFLVVRVVWRRVFPGWYWSVIIVYLGSVDTHSFVVQTFTAVTWCHECGQILFGLVRQGLQCTSKIFFSPKQLFLKQLKCFYTKNTWCCSFKKHIMRQICVSGFLLNWQHWTLYIFLYLDWKVQQPLRLQ